METAIDSGKQSVDSIELVTRWGLVALAVIVTAGALLRVFGAENHDYFKRLDQITLLYLAVGGALLLFRQIKSFSLGQLKLELIEKLAERQEKQEERLNAIRLVLPLLLPPAQVDHIRRLSAGRTAGYHGSDPLVAELRALAHAGLVRRKGGRLIASLKALPEVDTAEFVELTELGNEWARAIRAMDDEQKRGEDKDKVAG
jgi:hypothetical protein